MFRHLNIGPIKEPLTCYRLLGPTEFSLTYKSVVFGEALLKLA